MNGLDYAIIVVIALGTLQGLRQGALRMATSIVSLGAGVYAASMYYGRAASIAQAQFHVGPEAAAVIGYGAVFAIVCVAVQIAGTSVARLMNLVKLGWVDRIAGGAAGAAIVAVMSGVCVMLLTVVLPEDADLLRQSKLAPPLIACDERLISFIPAEARLSYEHKRDDLIEYWLKNRADGMNQEPEVMRIPEKKPTPSPQEDSTAKMIEVPEDESAPEPAGPTPSPAAR